jgi:hypothetical protein
MSCNLDSLLGLQLLILIVLAVLFIPPTYIVAKCDKNKGNMDA